jgi:dolichol kinase
MHPAAPDDAPRTTRRLPAREVGRKGLHLTSAVVPALLGLGVERRLLVAALAVLAASALLVELGRRRSRRVAARFDALFAPLLRAHERQRLTGATWLLLSFLAAVAVLPRDVAIAATWAAAGGDAAAASVGSPFGRHRVGRTGKSLEGSIACALATAIGVLFVAALAPWIALVAAVVAALAERASWPHDDNARIVAIVGAAVWLCTALAR